MEILNYRDYRLARARLVQLQRALERDGVIGPLTEQMPKQVANARRATLEGERARLAAQVQNYERLREDGLKVDNELDGRELGMVPILARTARKLSQKDLAEKLGMKEQQIQRYEREKYASISLDRFSKIVAALGVELHPRVVPEVIAVQNADVEIELTPELLRNLRKRNWVSLPRGASPLAMKDTLAKYIQTYTPLLIESPLKRQTRSKRPGGDLVNLWVARVLEIAGESRSRMRGKFNISDTTWLSQLISLSIFPDGPFRAQEMLKDHGIIMVIEPHLPGTMLDGAALLTLDGIPVVALTLRYDRIDNFWFTLLHELGHVFLHFGNGLSEGFIDDDLGEANVSAVEREADDFARTRLIPDDLWQAAPVRFTKSREAVEKFAGRLGVHPGIVAGRIRNERNYTLFADLVGNGQVRKLFAAYSS
jgi:HTH-type transcriptional regulator/antitoxin HigA